MPAYFRNQHAIHSASVRITVLVITLFTSALVPCAGQVQSCDKPCLETIADRYRTAYVHHNPSGVPIADRVRFTENNVEMPFPDASWDTVTEEIGPHLTLSDPVTGNIGIYTAIMQNDTPGFLAIRLQVKGGKITEIEHMLSTKRNLSSPPTPIGDVHQYRHTPVINETILPAQRLPRSRLIALADGYFATLERNNGEIRGTRFAKEATRLENGLLFQEIEKGFKSGYYAFNNRVRREPIFVDEERGVVMCRGFIDHKGVLDEYTLTDGTVRRSIFREPQSWALLEMFKIMDDRIVAVEATFIAVPYNMPSPWSTRLDP